ncbi:MAG: DUF192 domain-containing protein [Acidimicrobiia bacterium]|nr:DUF192 domain-containing protein [Acidimicrobiia bacterium]
MSEILFPGRVVYARGSLGRTKGLLGRDAMRRDEALWLSPCKSVHTFGMRFPIDVAFLDAGGTILHLVPGMRPRRFSRIVWGARGALEMHAGTLEAVGARVGDVVRWALSG